MFLIKTPKSLNKEEKNENISLSKGYISIPQIYTDK